MLLFSVGPVLCIYLSRNCRCLFCFRFMCLLQVNFLLFIAGHMLVFCLGTCVSCWTFFCPLSSNRLFIHSFIHLNHYRVNQRILSRPYIRLLTCEEYSYRLVVSRVITDPASRDQSIPLLPHLHPPWVALAVGAASARRRRWGAAAWARHDPRRARMQSSLVSPLAR